MSLFLTFLLFALAGVAVMVASFFIATAAGYLSRMYSGPFRDGQQAYDRRHKKHLTTSHPKQDPL